MDTTNSAYCSLGKPTYRKFLSSTTQEGTFLKNHTDLVRQPLKQPIGPRSARPCPDPQLTPARDRHMSTEHWSRVRNDLCTVGHVPLDATKINNRIIEKRPAEGSDSTPTAITLQGCQQSKL